MEINGTDLPGQCTYKLTEVTVRKDPAQQSTQKTSEGPRGHFGLNGDMVHQYCTWTAGFHIQQNKCNEKHWTGELEGR